VKYKYVEKCKGSLFKHELHELHE